MTATDTHRAIDAVWRIESPRLIAGRARMVRDVGLAEELAQDALVAALEQWPDGSFITFAFTRSRWARDLKTTHEKTTVSPGVVFTRRGNGTIPFTFRSSPTASRYSSAGIHRRNGPCRTSRV